MLCLKLIKSSNINIHIAMLYKSSLRIFQTGISWNNYIFKKTFMSTEMFCTFDRICLLISNKTWRSLNCLNVRSQNSLITALTGVAQVAGRRPTKQKIAGSIPDHGTCGGFGPVSGWCTCKRQPQLMFLSLSKNKSIKS